MDGEVEVLQTSRDDERDNESFHIIRTDNSFNVDLKSYVTGQE